MQVARVAASDEQWRAFRQAALTQGVSVSAYLGRLVGAELKRRRTTAVAVLEPEAGEAQQATAALADVRTAIGELDAIAGRLARSAVAHGASWVDVASSSGLSADEAETTFGGQAVPPGSPYGRVEDD